MEQLVSFLRKSAAVKVSGVELEVLLKLWDNIICDTKYKVF